MQTAGSILAIREAIRDCHQWLEATLADVSAEQAQWIPPGVANPIAAVYAHVIVGSDVAVHLLLQDQQPLIATRVNAGLSELVPVSDWHTWARRVQIDLTQFRAYADDVYAAWYRYLDALVESDLARTVDLSIWGMGQRMLDQFLLIQVEHFSCHVGEIACLKGLQGAVGFRPGTVDGIG